MIDLYAVNRDPLLRNTPLGDLQVVLHCGRICVGIKNPHNPSAPPRIVYESGRWGNPWAAIYGKRTHELTFVQQLAAQQEAQRMASYQRDDEQLDADLRREQEKIERKDPDAKAFLRAVGGEA